MLGLKEEVNGEESNDQLEAKVIGVAQYMGVELRPEEISVCHRIGKFNLGKTRTVICKFTHKKRRMDIMAKKNKLKDKEDEITIFEDLTQLRLKLLDQVKTFLKAKGGEYRVYTREAKIIVRRKNHQDQWKNTAIETPEDLKKIGITQEPDWTALGLADYVSTNQA